MKSIILAYGLIQAFFLPSEIAFGQQISALCSTTVSKSETEITAALNNVSPDELSDNDRKCASNLLGKLGEMRQPDTIQTLIAYLGLRRPLDEGEKKGFSLHPRSASYIYPAVSALAQIGPAIRVPLIEFIASGTLSETVRNNAVLAILGTEREEPEIALASMVKRLGEEKGTRADHIRSAINFAISGPQCKRRAGKCESLLTPN